MVGSFSEFVWKIIGLCAENSSVCRWSFEASEWRSHSVRRSCPSSIGAMRCPSCLIYDDLIDLCIDPCKELGANSDPCREFGCPTDESTTVQTSTVGQSPVPAHLLPASDRAATDLTVALTAVVVAIVSLTVITLLVIVLLRRRRRRSSVNGHTSRPNAGFSLLFYLLRITIVNFFVFVIDYIGQCVCKK